MAVRIEKKGGVWTVIHSRAQARNAMDPESADALVAAFEAFDRDANAKVAVLWGEGGAFCAGWDLKYCASLVKDPRQLHSIDYPLEDRKAIPGLDPSIEWPTTPETEIEVSVGTGLTYRLFPNWFIGAETQYATEFETEVGQERWSLFVGPTIHYGGKKFWATLTWFPQLKGARVTHSWTGNTAFTLDALPHMGQEGGLHYCLGCNGSGVAMMTYLGTQTARKIARVANAPCAFDAPEFPDHPLYSGNPWFLPLVGGYYRMRDRIDRMFA